MPKFESIMSCELDSDGNIVLVLTEADGKFREMTIDLALIPSLLTVLNKTSFLSPRAIFPEFVLPMLGMHEPVHIGLATLLEKHHALLLSTKAGMTIPLVATPGVLSGLLEAVTSLQAIQRAEEAAQKSGTLQ